MISQPLWTDAIARALRAAAAALGRLVTPPEPVLVPVEGWADQFSRYSHDQRSDRCRVQALYRARTVRL